MNNLLLLTSILSMGNQQVIDAVKLSIDNPDKYSMTYSSEPFESAVDGVYEGFSWYALVEQLIGQENQDLNLAAEIDWKAENEDVFYVLGLVLKAHHFDVDLSALPTNDDEEDPQELLKIIGEALKKKNIALVGIWIDSDSYVFSALPLDKWQNIAHLFSGDRGYGLVVLFQKNMPIEF